MQLPWGFSPLLLAEGRHRYCFSDVVVSVGSVNFASNIPVDLFL